MVRRPTIGFLVDSIQSYQSTVLAGVLDAAAAADVSVLCFCGGVFEAGDSSAPQRNAIYEFVDPRTVDGLVVLSGSIGNIVGPAEMAAFCAAYRPLPIVSIAAALDGVPSVVVEDDTGMRDAVAHVIDVHARRQIAFIRGPQANEEAERRYRIYREVLEDRGLRFHPDLVVHGTFERASGEKSVGVLVDERKMHFDAIIAASDEMAIGAVRELLARGIRVPDEVAVVGFDDVEAAQFCFPPLTTVRQPLYEQGRIATEMLLAELRKESAPSRMLLHTRLVTRRSCGCGPDGSIDTPILPEGEDLETLLRERGANVVGEVLSALGASPTGADSRWSGRLVSAFVTEVGGGSAQFLRVLDDALRARLASGEPIGSWQNALSALRRQTLGWFSRPVRRSAAEDLLHAARALTGRYAELAQADRRTNAESFARVLNETSGALATSFDRATLLANLKKHLPRLGIDRMYLSVFRGHGQSLRSSRLLFAIDPDDPERTIDPHGPTFPSKWLVPQGTLPKKRSDFVVQPLFFDSERFGTVLLEMGPRSGRIYETLRDQISAALKGSELVQRVIEHDHQRQRLLRYILDVTPDMQRVQPLADLYQKILGHALGMLAARRADAEERDSSIPPPLRAGLLASVEGSAMIVRASTVPGTLHAPIEQCLDAGQLERVHAALENCAVEVGEHSAVIPLRAGETTLAVVHLDCAGAILPDTELLSTLANQASAAIRSMQLYEIAALDPVTGAHTRRFLDDWLLREVKAAFRAAVPLSLLMIDVDEMKRINDRAGHLAGDRALATVGKVLRESTRPTDLVGRFGGDEFAVLLPRTGTRAAERVALRMITSLGERSDDPPLRISIGSATLPASASLSSGSGSVPPEYFQQTSESLVKRADDALYRAKRRGGMRVCSSRPSVWAVEAVTS
jgi:diguanylate cyclase (GGDEF)-like protein